MVTLQDISIQLMKPAKDLADWNFPLSQVNITLYLRLIMNETLLSFVLDFGGILRIVGRTMRCKFWRSCARPSKFNECICEKN